MTAADVPALLRLFAAGDRAPCDGDDANGDGELEPDNPNALISAIFTVPAD